MGGMQHAILKTGNRPGDEATCYVFPTNRAVLKLVFRLGGCGEGGGGEELYLLLW